MRFSKKNTIYVLFLNVVYCEQIYQNFERIKNKNIIATKAITYQRDNIEYTRICLYECTKNRFCTAVAINKITNICKLMENWLSEPGDLVNANDWDVYNGVHPNVAVGKPTSQSSTFVNIPPDGNRGASYYAVDNIFETNYYAINDNSCTATKEEQNPWWMIDLGSSRLIHAVRLLNRADCCHTRLSNVLVTVGIIISNMEICGEHIPAVGAGAKVTINCRNGYAKGRYVKVELQKKEFLTLCEVTLIARL